MAGDVTALLAAWGQGDQAAFDRLVAIVHQKRGAGVRPIPLNEELDYTPERSADLLALDDSLNALEAIDPRKCKVVELKFFGGLTTAEIAEVLGVSEPTALRDWKLARSWLQREMKRT